MKHQVDADILEKLRDLRNDPSKLKEFRGWLDENKDRLTQQISAGAFLKLRSHNIQTVMSSVAALVPSCQECSRIGISKVFSSRAEHLSYAHRVDFALSKGLLFRIKRPSWLHPEQFQLGVEAYFLCTCCGSIWSLVEPERKDNGLWQRFA